MLAQDRRGRLSIRLIQEAFLELLEEKEFLQITVSEICMRAEVNRTTFYRYFDNQYQLKDMIEQQLLTQLEEHEMSQLLFNPTPENILKAIEVTTDSFRCMLHDLDAYRIFSTKVYPSVLDVFLDGRRSFMKDALSRSLQPNIESLTETYILGGSNAYIKSWLLNEQRESPEEAARALVGMSVAIATVACDQFTITATLFPQASAEEGVAVGHRA